MMPLVLDPSDIIPYLGLGPAETKRSIFTMVYRTQSPVQSCPALEAMTGKKAFTAGFCCLILSGMHSPRPFDL